MKKYFIFTFVFFAIGLLLIAIISYANTSNLSNYYPSQSGNYTKVHLINQSGGPDANNCFCSQSATYPTGIKSGAVCDTGDSGVTYSNPAGTIFSDVTTGYLEICKSDGTAASYPGACFNRYNSSFTGCPSKYVAIPSSPSKSLVFSSAAGSAAGYTWSCCFTGQNASTTATKAGCFSIYSNTYSPSSPYSPAACTDSTQGDPNAYDIGCDVISPTSGNTQTVYKRNCCFNNSAGTSIGSVNSCNAGSSSSSGGQASSSGSGSGSGSSGGSSGSGSQGSSGSSGAGSSSGSHGASSGGSGAGSSGSSGGYGSSSGSSGVGSSGSSGFGSSGSSGGSGAGVYCVSNGECQSNACPLPSVCSPSGNGCCQFSCNCPPGQSCTIPDGQGNLWCG